MLAAVLWLGNISFSVMDNENHIEVMSDEGLSNAAKLLGCSVQNLIIALSSRRIRAGKDTIVQKMTLSQAIDARDALAKSIYTSLFDWLVAQINKSLEVGKSHTGRSISILDIYGFETFHKNSFEQFCINYANERLQQHFNRHLFKLEQEGIVYVHFQKLLYCSTPCSGAPPRSKSIATALTQQRWDFKKTDMPHGESGRSPPVSLEYILDGIDWTRVDFIDNTECLNLFEKVACERPLGLLSLLDEESTFPKATDLTFANKLKEHLNYSSCFKGERGGAFTVRHYAGEVSYDTSGFLEKNRDPLHSGAIQLLLSSSSQLPKLFASDLLDQSQKVLSPLGRSKGTDLQRQSVCMKFKTQLFKLMQRLESTTPHFIRCIKPNSKQLPGFFENNIVLQQLRCCGVLEIVRISRAGYPTRMTHQSFAERYGILLLENVSSQDPLSVSVAILQQFNILPDMYQVGFTKLFFRTGQIAVLEDARNRTLHGILGVQKCFRGFQARRNFKDLKNATTTLQTCNADLFFWLETQFCKFVPHTVVRGENARSDLKVIIKRWRAAIFIQKHVKRWIARKILNEQQKAAILLQSGIRGQMARKQIAVMKDMQLSRAKDVKVENSLDKISSHLKDTGLDHPPLHHSKLAELQRRVFQVEEALHQKEEENISLREQLKQYETRWSEYEAKMRSMEEMWQKQLTSLQASLAEARRSLTTDDTASQPGKADVSPALHFYDSEDATSMGTRTPEGTPPKITRPSNVKPLRDANGVQSAVSHLMKEFEQRKQVFEDDAQFVIEVKSGQSDIEINPDGELRQLKARFVAWKKEYKLKLRETKASLHKLGNAEGDKTRRKWWGKRYAKGS
ncbi:hypothetical protein Taro_046694 [Colocasia esculenta]|uniref:Myosin motor domain-containing protein n=1 Tax=Colocasia esculenta TaxID=4460 RepID=A0A843X2S8_COLES|nr:hypothetical protein [Colocasia esculenta]